MLNINLPTLNLNNHQDLGERKSSKDFITNFLEQTHLKHLSF